MTLSHLLTPAHTLTPRAPIRPVPTRRDWIALAALLLIAFLARWADLGTTTHFQYDQAAQALLAQDMLAGHGIAWVGPESTGTVHHSPLTVWFLIPPYALTNNPLRVHLFIVAFNVLGVGLLWGLAFRYLGGRRAAFAAGLIYALHPYAILYNRTIWVPDFLIPFLLAGFGLALLGFVEGKRWAQVLSLPVLLIGLQMHFAGWLILPAWAWLALWGWRRIDGRALAASVVLAALVMLPYAVGIRQSETDAASGRLDTMRTVIQYDFRLRAETLRKFADVAIGTRSADHNSTSDLQTILAAVPEPSALWSLAGALMAAGWLSLWLRRVTRPYGVFFTLWMAILVGFFIPNWTGTGIYRHHFIPVIPALCLLAGLGVAFLLERARRFPLLQWITVTLLAALVLSWLGWVVSMWRYTDQHYLPEKTPLPIHYLLDVRADLRDDRDVLLIGADSHTSGVEVWRSLLYDSAECVRAVIALQGGLTVIPAGPFVAVAPPGADPSTDLYQQYLGDQPQTYPTRPGERPYSVQRHPDGLAWEGPELAALGPVTFANRVQLTGTHVERGRVRLRWALPGRTENAGYLRQFVHLLDSQGGQLAGMDLDFWPGQSWCAGDQIITWADLALPEGAAPVTLRAGLYTVQDDGSYRYVDVVDSAGHPAAPWVELPLTED